MISCNKNSIIFRLTLIVLIVESHWTEEKNHNLKNVDNSSKAEQHCWHTETFDIIEPCHPCSEFEIASRSVEACIPTHFKEGIKCHVSGKTQRRYEEMEHVRCKNLLNLFIVFFIFIPAVPK